MLFRMYVSRRAARKGRAVLEGVGLDSPTIDTFFDNNPYDVESAVQAGLIKWSGGQGFSSTWQVLCEAMEFGELAKMDIEDLKEALKNPPSNQTGGM